MDSIKCEVCFHSFSISRRRPRCLPCGHSFCSICLKQIVNGNIITCPTCREFYEIDHLQQIPINYSMEKLLGMDNGIKLFSEKKTCNCTEKGEMPMKSKIEKKDALFNINFLDSKTNDCQCEISNPSYENSTTDGAEEVWWLGKSRRSSLPSTNPQGDQIDCIDYKSSDKKYSNHEINCRNHREEIEFYCLNHKEWICKKCTKESHLKVECTIITKEEEIRGRKLEEENNSCTTNSRNTWWLGKELPNETNTEKEQIHENYVATNNQETKTYCKIHNEKHIYFCLNHQEWLCQLCTMVMHPKQECTVITKDEELKGRKLKFYELSSETNCIKHNKEIVLFCLNHKKWICKKCTYGEHPKHECTVITKEEELRGKKVETEEKLKICIGKYDLLISKLHNWFLSDAKRKDKFGKLSNDDLKHKDNLIKNVLDQAEENKWRLELTLRSLCSDGTIEELQDNYSNVTELVTTMVNWEQEQQYWFAQQKQQCDDTNDCQKLERQIIEYERNKDRFSQDLQSSRMKLQLSEEQQLSLRQQILQMQIQAESLRGKMRNTFVWCSILCLSVIIVSLWFIGNINVEMVMNESQNIEQISKKYPLNIEVISQKQPVQKIFNEKCVINRINRNSSTAILKLERHLIDSLDQKYKLQMKYDEAMRQFNYIQMKMKQILNERNDFFRKLENSHITKNETKPEQNSSCECSFIKNYFQQIDYFSSVITGSFYWALCLNLSFISFFIAVYVSFSFDSWLCSQTKRCDNGKFSYIFFVFMVYVMFCEINSFLTWITGIEPYIGTSSFLSVLNNSLVSNCLLHFLFMFNGTLATGISAVIADGIGKKMKSFGYHSDYCHCTVVIVWFLLIKEFSLASSWVVGTTDA